MRELTGGDVCAAKAIFRGEPVDVSALASFLSTTTEAARMFSLVTSAPNHSLLFARRIALGGLMRRMGRNADSSSIASALVVFDVLRKAEAPMHRAPALAPGGLVRLRAALDGRLEADIALADLFIVRLPAITEVLGVIAATRALDLLVMVGLALRLDGAITDLREILAAIQALAKQEIADLTRLEAH